jgi:hypothetical protein
MGELDMGCPVLTCVVIMGSVPRPGGSRQRRRGFIKERGGVAVGLFELVHQRQLAVRMSALRTFEVVAANRADVFSLRLGHLHALERLYGCSGGGTAPVIGAPSAPVLHVLQPDLHRHAAGGQAASLTRGGASREGGTYRALDE